MNRRHFLKIAALSGVAVATYRPKLNLSSWVPDDGDMVDVVQPDHARYQCHATVIIDKVRSIVGARIRDSRNKVLSIKKFAPVNVIAGDSITFTWGPVVSG